jgi:hypothetical protein
MLLHCYNHAVAAVSLLLSSVLLCCFIATVISIVMLFHCLVQYWALVVIVVVVFIATVISIIMLLHCHSQLPLFMLSTACCCFSSCCVVQFNVQLCQTLSFGSNSCCCNHCYCHQYYYAIALLKSVVVVHSVNSLLWHCCVVQFNILPSLTLSFSSNICCCCNHCYCHQYSYAVSLLLS